MRRHHINASRTVTRASLVLALLVAFPFTASAATKSRYEFTTIDAPVVIRGPAELDVTQIAPASLRLNGLAPLHIRRGDPAGPACDGDGDGSLDLVLTFDPQALIQGLAPVVFGQSRILELTGRLKETFGGLEIPGSDSLIIRRPKQ